MRGLVFKTSGPLAALAAVVGSACRRLTEANVPHNLFIVDRGARVFLVPNAFAERKVPACPQHPVRPGTLQHHRQSGIYLASSQTPSHDVVNRQSLQVCRNGSPVQFTGRVSSGRSQPGLQDVLPWLEVVPLCC